MTRRDTLVFSRIFPTKKTNNITEPLRNISPSIFIYVSLEKFFLLSLSLENILIFHELHKT